jgi:predicted nucleic acid-binding protein
MFNLNAKKYNRITLDESIFRFALEQDETYGEVALKLLEQIEGGEIEQAYLSALSYAKLVSHYDNEEVARKVQVLLSHFPNLTIIPFDSKAAEQTASVQRRYGLSFDQSVVLATAILSQSQLLITEVKANRHDISSMLWWDVEDVNSMKDVN